MTADVEDLTPEQVAEIARTAHPIILGRQLRLDHPVRLYRHSVLISRAIAEAAHTPNGRLIITVPPRHGKSFLASMLGPLWHLEMWPHKRVIVASYAQQLAAHYGRLVRNTIGSNPDRLNVRLAEDSTAAHRWNTPQGGGMLATGVGGLMTGFGGDLIVCDDLYKNWQEARSKTIRERVDEWYRSVAYTRLEPDASMVLVFTRWHEDDLIGSLVDEMEDGDGETWTVLRLPAIAEDPDDPALAEMSPIYRQPDPLGREPGEALCPERYDEADLTRMMRSVGAMLAAGLYQQRPAPIAGSMFKRDDWVYGSPPPPGDMGGLVRQWDLAATDEDEGGDPDWLAGTLLGRVGDVTYVLDVVHERVGPAKLEGVMAAAAQRDRETWGPGKVLQRVEQEPGASGKLIAARYVDKVFRGHRAEAKTSSGDKETRAVTWAGAVGNGQVQLCRERRPDGTVDPEPPSWWIEFVEEHALFPHAGEHDDMVDTGALGFLWLEGSSGVSRLDSVASMSRTGGGQQGRGSVAARSLPKGRGRT